MLKSIRAANYRNLEIADGLSFGPLNIFVGPNGSGKSNTIQILRFLQQALTQAVADERRGITAFEDAIAEAGAGRISNIVLSKPNVVTISVDLALQDQYVHCYALDLLVQRETEVTISAESLSRRSELSLKNETPYYYFQRPDPSGRAAGTLSVFKEAPETKTKLISIPELPGNETAFLAIQPWLEANANSPVKDTPYFEGRRTVVEDLATWSFYNSSDMSVLGARRYPASLRQRSGQLSETGENVVEVLHYLMNGRSSAFEVDLETAWRQLFPRTGRLRVIPVVESVLELLWYYDKADTEHSFSLREMSDGTVRMLFWATVLLSPRLPSLIVIDEPEAGVHPAWLQVLADWIRRAARKTQVIVSTHSPDLLDYFTDDANCVYVFGESSDHDQTVRPQRLDPEALQPKFSEGWKLGDLYRVGDPSVGGWPW